MPTASNLFGLLALLCVVLPIGALAGPWWAVLTAAPVFGWLAYLAHLAEQQQRAAAAQALLEQERTVAERPHR